jgi:hypothetical protein
MHGFTHPQGASSQTNLRRLAPIIAVLAALSLPQSTTQAAAQTQPAPDNEDTGSLPQLSDFTPPYTCPWFFGRPDSCDKPITVSVECVDLRTLKIPQQLTREMTSTELLNADTACSLLPQWIEQDPRMHVVSKSVSEIKLIYTFSPNRENFTGVFVRINEKNFGVIKSEHENLNDKASYFVEKSIVGLEERGYLP